MHYKECRDDIIFSLFLLCVVLFIFFSSFVSRFQTFIHRHTHTHKMHTQLTEEESKRALWPYVHIGIVMVVFAPTIQTEYSYGIFSFGFLGERQSMRERERAQNQSERIHTTNEGKPTPKKQFPLLSFKFSECQTKCNASYLVPGCCCLFAPLPSICSSFLSVNLFPSHHTLSVSKNFFPVVEVHISISSTSNFQ